ncbi:MAG: hypothetical protein WA210_09110 [Burkholderiaceae bacterium]
MQNGNGQKRELPHWLASTVNRVVDIWTIDSVLTSGFFAHAGDGFIELVERSHNPEGLHASAPPVTYTHTFIHIQHICRIAPAAAQWRPNAGLAVPEKPKLVVP